MPISRDDLRELLEHGEWMDRDELLERCEELIPFDEAIEKYQSKYATWAGGSDMAIPGGRKMILDKRTDEMVRAEIIEQRGVRHGSRFRLPKRQGGGCQKMLKYHATSIRQIQKRIVADVLEIGGHLRAARDELEHGAFTRWVENETGMTARNARRFLAVHDAFGKTDNLSVLDIGQSALFTLAADSVPESAREEAITLANTGTRISNKLAITIVSRHTEQDTGTVAVVIEEPAEPAWDVDDCLAELREVVERWRESCPNKRKLRQLSKALSSLAEQVLSDGLDCSSDEQPAKRRKGNRLKIRVVE